jgi:hypothetical protein
LFTAWDVFATSLDMYVHVMWIVDWFAVGYSYAPRPYTGPLCTALSLLRQLQRRSMSRKRENPLLAKEGMGREMADINFACDPTSM